MEGPDLHWHNPGLILYTKRKPVFQTNLENRLFLTGSYRGVHRAVQQ